MPVEKYFLGANSYSGFFSLMDRLQEPGRLLFILKGGPGSGKSSFMRRLTKQLGDPSAELILCSGDPDSLDGVIFPSLGFAAADGTAPHVLEPVYAGVSAVYADLSRFCDWYSLRRREKEIRLLSDDYRAHYSLAYAALSRAGLKSPRRALSAEERKAAENIASEMTGQEPGAASPAKERFLSALTCRGALTMPPAEGGGRTVLLEGDGDFASAVISAAAERLGGTLCRDPLRPERAMQLISPGLTIAAKSHFFPFPKSGAETVFLPVPRAPEPETELLEAAAELEKAKRSHDELEVLYNPFTDFDEVYDAADLLAARMRAQALTSGGK